MNPALGDFLRVRAMVYVAGEPVPYFWPMRSFIHHNPLHGLEHLPFQEAVEQGAKLFHARGYLPRSQYQEYLADGRLDPEALRQQIEDFCREREAIGGVDLSRWILSLLETQLDPLYTRCALASSDDVLAVRKGESLQQREGLSDELIAHLRHTLLVDKTLYEAVDAIYACGIGEELDELVVRSCLDFFDEGQSVWVMPDREQGFFDAWRNVAGRKVRALLRRIEAAPGAESGSLSPEKVIDYIMRDLQVPHDKWVGYFTREIVHLHGWAGFIRWRASAKHYHWSERYPGDLVDLLAVRLSLAWVLLHERDGGRWPKNDEEIENLIAERPDEVFLRLELNSGRVLPGLAQEVDASLGAAKPARIHQVFERYLEAKRLAEAQRIYASLRKLAEQLGEQAVLESLDDDELTGLIGILRELEREEGMIWLRAMEAKSMDEMLDGISLKPPAPREKRPFVQAAFCIDTRSERIRRHLEAVGDYQTFGIAGFFGVPLSLMELGKGGEMHLCPVLLTPKNLVLEMSSAVRTDEAAFTTLERAMHNLKESVISPFVTVEAIGLLFGFDMIGKTMMPRTYNRWRKHLHEHKPSTHLLHDKLSREQADSIVRAVQRAVIVEAAEFELQLSPEDITDDVIRELREAALGNAVLGGKLAEATGIGHDRLLEFVSRLRTTYRINASFARLQLEQLGRIGFSLDEQASFVLQALSSIGLTKDFSRFILLVGHGSTSENNPYESALDCGACGGNHGLVSARVLAQMANKPLVRKRLANKGIEIPDDAWFIPAMHDTTTDEVSLFDLELLPTSHLVYLDRLRSGLTAAARLCAQERMPSLELVQEHSNPAEAFSIAQRNAMDWSQVRPEWGLARNAYFVIGRRSLTQSMALEGRAFLHSYDYRVDPKRRLLENILTGPLVVGQWINMEHYFSAVDNERFGSGSKVYHNVAGRFGVMTGNLGDLRTGLPAQTVLDQGKPHHEPQRLITLIEAPFEHAVAAIESVVSVKRLVRNGWVRALIIDPETGLKHIFEGGEWVLLPISAETEVSLSEELTES